VLTSLIVVLGAALLATRPWTVDGEDRIWFETSALLAAILLGASLLTMA
jgi:hypothetical protein